MNLQSVKDTAFALGYIDGRKFKTYFSRAQAERKFRGLPDSVIECYLNGRDDGVKNDDFRYRALVTKQVFG